MTPQEVLHKIPSRPEETENEAFRLAWMKYKVLTASGGGARVITSIIGAILAFEQAGIGSDWFELVVALSGSLPALGAWKHGTPGPVLARRGVEKKFVSLLTRKTSILGWLWSIARNRVSEPVFPNTGIWDTEPLGEYFASLIEDQWPRGLVTAAVTALYQKRTLVLFGEFGVKEQTPDGYELLLSMDEMHKLGRSMAKEAMRYTVTIPGIIKPLLFESPKRKYFLFDGVFSEEGPFLKRPILDPKLFGYSPDQLLVFTVGEDEGSDWTIVSPLQDFLYKVICQLCFVPKCPEGQKDGLLVISPNIMEFSSVNFWVGEYTKLLALLKGYEATVETLNKGGLLTPAMFAKATRIIAETRALHRRYRWMKWFFLNNWRARKMKELLARHGMYDLGEQTTK